MVLVQGPLQGVFADIRANLIPLVFVADDMFVIIALRQSHPRHAADAIDPLGGGRFEPSDERPYCLR